MSILSIIIISILLAVLGASVFFNIKFGLLILKIQDGVEESLDMLDERYASISKILEIPLFYDSVEIRSVLKDVELARDSMLEVARTIAVIDETVVDESVIDSKDIEGDDKVG
jgi:hypothetical protein